ncbi:MAG: hypothetical protein Q9180_006633 [Flavoplaca navasiana]
MADTACDRLSGLSAELRQTIANSIPREALKNLRVVSKCWNEVATPTLFSEFTYRIHTTPAEWSARVNFEKGDLVKKLNLTMIEFRDWDSEDYEHRVTPGARDDVPEHRDEPLRKAYAIYQRMRNDHMELLRKPDCLESLISLLESMKNLREVRLTGDYRAVYEFYPYSKEYGHCDLLDCHPSSPADLVGYHPCLDVSPRTGLVDMGSAQIQTLLSAIVAARSPFLELRIESVSGGGIYYHALDIPPTVDNLSGFSRLTKLHLVFDNKYEDDDERFGFDPFALRTVTFAGQYMSSVARSLSYASNLRHLTLRMQYFGYDTYEETDIILRGCKLPELLTCELRYSSAKDTTLARFVRGCPKLSHLTIQHLDHGSQDGSPNDEEFAHVLNRTRDALRKERPQLNLKTKKGRYGFDPVSFR